jgi:hypothetical protein
MRKKRKIDWFKNIKVTIDPELNNKYDNEPFFQKKLEIAKKELGNPQDIMDAFKRIEEEELVKAKRRKAIKSVKNLKRPIKKARAITR